MTAKSIIRLFFSALTIVWLFSNAQVATAQTCVWYGTAPACNGACPAGFTLAQRDKEGDGRKCVTGTKAYCCLTSVTTIRGNAPFCNGKCRLGEEMLGDSDYGPNGNKCVTGKAAICRVSTN